MFETQIPRDTAKAPINNPITTTFTPSHNAPPAARAAPAVHKGQCAMTLSNKIKKKNNVEEIMRLYILQLHKSRVASILGYSINLKFSGFTSRHSWRSRWHSRHSYSGNVWLFF